MRFILITVLVVMLPAALLGGPVLGVYFTYTPEQGHYDPSIGEAFNAYIYVHTWDCMLASVEFAIEVDHPSIIYNGFTIPEGWLNLGDPLSGVSITWFPPISDFEETHLLVCTVHYFSTDTCIYLGGSMLDLPVEVLPHPDGGGAGGGVYVVGACWPEYDIIQFEPRSGIICPDWIATEEMSWGAIKSLVE
ncbi:MAG: hypothetical protein JSV33_11975 [bacterium]|nr:MAG: hypothetical protein JSV33_11975 [bacterium]